MNNYLIETFMKNALTKSSTRRKVKYKRIGDIFFIERKFINDKFYTDEDYAQRITMGINCSIIDLYQKDLIEIEIPSIKSEIFDKISFLNINDLVTRYRGEKFKSDIIDPIFNNISILREKNGSMLNNFYKIFSGENIIYFHINDFDNDTLQIKIFNFDPKKKIISILYYIFDEKWKDNSNDITKSISQSALFPAYISSKDKYFENHINIFYKYLSNDMIDGIMYIEVIKIILSVISNTSYTNDNKKPFNHTPFEMNIFNRIYKNLNIKDRMLTIKKWIQSDNLTNVTNSDKVLEDEDMDLHNIVNNPSLECPFIDFTRKEIKYINGFIENSNMYSSEDPKHIIDFVEVFKNPRYGKELMMDIDLRYENDKLSGIIPTRMNFTYEYNEINDSLKIYARMELVNKQIGVIKFIFGNISNFKYKDSFLLLSTQIYQSDKETLCTQLPSNFDDASECAPEIFYDKVALAGLGADIISIYVILHERPARSKVIRETTKVTDYEYTNHKYGKMDKVYGKKKESFIIRRILKTTKDAKEYISKMVADGQSNREYTLEVWDRIGHYRRKPNSEEKIWIQPTKCHRRLEISNREVHIKL